MLMSMTDDVQVLVDLVAGIFLHFTHVTHRLKKCVSLVACEEENNNKIIIERGNGMKMN